MGSLEELFIRIEATGLTGKGEILDWVSDNGKRKKSSYENISNIIAEPLAIRQETEQLEIPDSIAKNKTKIKRTINKLNELKNDAIGSEVNETTTLSQIDDKLKIARRVQLRAKGSLASAFREELRDAKTEKQAEKILEEAYSEIGDGKNYDSLVAGIQALKQAGRYD